MRRYGTLSELKIVHAEPTRSLAEIAARFRNVDRSSKAHEPVTGRNARSNSTEIGPLPEGMARAGRTIYPVKAGPLEAVLPRTWQECHEFRRNDFRSRECAPINHVNTPLAD